MSIIYGINTTLGDLDLVSATMDANDRLVLAFDIFAKEPALPGLIVLKDGKFFRMLSKTGFFEAMSQQYMLDIYSRRSAHFFFEEYTTEISLILDSNLPVLNAATITLQRPVKNRFDPIVVQCSEGDYRLLDYYMLLMAENQVHIQTSRLLREANEFKKEVLGVVAHDLRNPIGVIQGFANILNESVTEDDDLKEYTKIIIETTEQMNNMVNDILVSAINDSTDFTIHPAPFDLTRLINQIVTNFKEQTEAKNQTIHFYHSENPILVNADNFKIREVFENLISNAIKYSEIGKQIKIFANRLVDTVEIKVQDEGPGLTDDDKSKIFGKFTRLSAKPTAGESSTGLGLFIVKKIIKLHGGRIRVETVLGEGSAFIFELPLISTDKGTYFPL